MRLTELFEENLHTVSTEELEAAESIDYLLSMIPALTNEEREYLIVNGFDPDTGRDLD